jgi:hypothetical protein
MKKCFLLVVVASLLFTGHVYAQTPTPPLVYTPTPPLGVRALIDQTCGQYGQYLPATQALGLSKEAQLRYAIGDTFARAARPGPPPFALPLQFAGMNPGEGEYASLQTVRTAVRLGGDLGPWTSLTVGLTRFVSTAGIGVVFGLAMDMAIAEKPDPFSCTAAGKVFSPPQTGLNKDHPKGQCVPKTTFSLDADNDGCEDPTPIDPDCTANPDDPGCVKPTPVNYCPDGSPADPTTGCTSQCQADPQSCQAPVYYPDGGGGGGPWSDPTCIWNHTDHGDYWTCGGNEEEVPTYKGGVRR